MPQTDTCEVCGNSIQMQIRRGTGICSENCQKQATIKETPSATA